MGRFKIKKEVNKLMKAISISLPDELYNKIEEEGKESERKVSTHIRFILKERFDKVDKEEDIQISNQD